MMGSAYIHGLMDGEAIKMMNSGLLEAEKIILSDKPLPV